MRRILSVPEAGIVVTCLVLAGLFQLINPVFLSAGNIATMLRAMAYTGIVGIGLAICLISGTIDLSVGAVAGLAGVVFAKLLQFGAGLFLSMVAGLGVGLFAGALNSAIIIWLRVTPFITTIGTMYVIRGLASFVSNGFTVYPLPEEVTVFGVAQPGGVSWAFWIMVVIMVVLGVLLKTTTWGLCLRATGSDADTARNTEVDVVKVQTSALLIVGVLAALAGMLASMMLSAGVPTMGTGWELVAIAGCVVGGVSLFGYSGSMVGLFFGLLTLQIIQNGIVTMGLSSYFQQVAVGCILLLVVITDTRRRISFNLEKV